MADRNRAPKTGPCIRSSITVTVRRFVLWIPAVAAMFFLAYTGVVMVKLADETKRAVLANLYNTCQNSEKLRPSNIVYESCWRKYEELGGGNHP
jgi:hypothetical protein